MRESDIVKTVLSAKSFLVRFEASGKSLTYIRNKRGPRVDPCGTPLTSNLKVTRLASTAFLN